MLLASFILVPCRQEMALFKNFTQLLNYAGSVSNVSKIRDHKTSTGIKDTFLVGLMHQSYKSKANRHDKQVALIILEPHFQQMQIVSSALSGEYEVSLHYVIYYYLCVSKI